MHPTPRRSRPIPKTLDTPASQRRGKAAQERGFFDREIVKVCVKKGKTETIVEKDEHPRGDTTMEILAKLPAAFRDGGSVTAGNSSGINDAACAMIIASEAAAKANGLTPRARIVSVGVVGTEPTIMLTGPAPSARKALAKAGLDFADIDLFEVNEAFASIVLSWLAVHGADPARVNVNGGAIALGHPVGSTGARLLTTALHELERRGAGTALVTMCAGGAMATATIIERL